MSKQSLFLGLIVVFFMFSSSQAQCTIFDSQITLNNTFYLNFTNSDLFKVNFVAFVRSSNSQDDNNYILFTLSDSSTGALVHTFPPLTGAMTVAKSVIEIVLPCDTDHWPNFLTLNVTFFSPASITIQVTITTENTDFFQGKFQPGAATSVQSFISYDNYFFTLEVPSGDTRYDINFTIVGATPGTNIPFSQYCLAPFFSACNTTCLLNETITNGTKFLWFGLENIGTGAYSATFGVNALQIGVQITANVTIHEVIPVTTTSDITSGTNLPTLTSSGTSTSSTGTSTSGTTLTGNSTTTKQATTGQVTSGQPTTNRPISTSTTTSNGTRLAIPLLFFALVVVTLSL